MKKWSELIEKNIWLSILIVSSMGLFWGAWPLGEALKNNAAKIANCTTGQTEFQNFL